MGNGGLARGDERSDGEKEREAASSPQTDAVEKCADRDASRKGKKKTAEKAALKKRSWEMKA